jgi:hypothetical protein
MFESVYTTLLAFQRMAIRLSHTLDALSPFLNFSHFGPIFTGISFLLWQTVPQEPNFPLQRL